jgi:hypothetical protein
MEWKYAIEVNLKQAVMTAVTVLMAKHAELSLRIPY